MIEDVLQFAGIEGFLQRLREEAPEGSGQRTRTEHGRP
jgi:hypothetical protein